jgi:hypothetical protein
LIFASTLPSSRSTATFCAPMGFCSIVTAPCDVGAGTWPACGRAKACARSCCSLSIKLVRAIDLPPQSSSVNFPEGEQDRARLHRIGRGEPKRFARFVDAALIDAEQMRDDVLRHAIAIVRVGCAQPFLES